MLTLLAALIPIVGSLYVAASQLVEQSRLAHERRVRVRVQDLGAAYQSAIEARARPSSDGRPAYTVAMDERIAFEERMRAYSGVVGRGPTMGELDIDLAMSGPELSMRDRRNQWILLASALAGVVILATSELQI